MASEVIGELQGISYSITREKAPIYTMGSADPRAFSRGKRGIAGTLVFVVFDRHVILSKLGGYAPQGGLQFLSDIDDIRPGFNDPNVGAIPSTTPIADIQNGSLNTVTNTVDKQESSIDSVGADQALAGAWYADQIPPFDITLAAANEYGAMAVMRIFGVELLNEGSGVSIDDIVTEQQHTYVARSIIGWSAVNSPYSSIIASQGGVSTGS